MKDYSSEKLTREERELIYYFRSLPVQQQLDILGSAEADFNAFERMKELARRDVERKVEEKRSGWH